MITGDTLPQAPPKQGAIIGDKYLLGEPLDPSGEGRVFRARDLAHGRDVAIKLLGPHCSSSVPGVQAEAQDLARLSHPNVAEVHEVSEWDGLRYVVMELVPGETLASAIRGRGPLGPLESVRIAIHVAEGLSAVHKLGLVHCDVKPANIVVTPEGSAKLVDFGSARPEGRDESDRVVGSAPYIAPERLTGRDVDGQADVYSLGATLYEMLTGQPPVLGPDDEETIRRALRGDVVPPTLINRDLPEDLAAVVMKALARLPEQRYSTALAMASALRTVASRLSAGSAASTSEFARSESTLAIPILAATRRKLLRHRPLAAGVIAAALLALGLWGIVGGSTLGVSPASASPRLTPLPTPQTAVMSVPSPTQLPSPTAAATSTAVPTVDLSTPDPTAVPTSQVLTLDPTAVPTQAPASTPRQPAQVRPAASGGGTASKSDPQPKAPQHPAKPSHTKSGKGHGRG